MTRVLGEVYKMADVEMLVPELWWRIFSYLSQVRSHEIQTSERQLFRLTSPASC